MNDAGVRTDARIAEDRSRRLVTALRVFAVVGVLGCVELVRAWVRSGDGYDWLASYWGGGLAVLGIAHAVVAICWLSWFDALYDVARDIRRARFGSGGLWFWVWVIPIASLFLPKYLVNDVWWAADPPDERSPLPKQVQLWWSCWVAASAIGMAARSSSLYVATLPLLTLAAVFGTGAVETLTDRVRLLAARTRLEPALDPVGP
jgi:hypothetical protein